MVGDDDPPLFQSSKNAHPQKLAENQQSAEYKMHR